MPRVLELAAPVDERPQEAWGSIAAELAGTETTVVQGKHWVHRVIHAGSHGPALVLNHGIGGHAETFARSIRTLAEHFRVFAVDAVFHGYSGKQDFDLPRMYDLLAEGYIDLIDALGLQSAHYLGESMGAQTGVTIGLRYPERVDKMILNAGFYANGDHSEPAQPVAGAAAALGRLSALAVLEPTRENVANRLAWLVADQATITDDLVSVRQHIYQDPDVSESMRKVFNLDAGIFGSHLYDLGYDDADLDGWKPDSLVLWGEKNPGHGPGFGASWADRLGAQFYVIRDAGHWPQWERPDEYNAVVLQYLTS